MKSNKEVSRRQFLQTTAAAGVVAGMTAVAIPLSAGAADGPEQAGARHEHPLEAILSRYGSELGHLKQAR